MALFDNFELPATADFHVHLREGKMLETVIPTIRKGGVDTVYVMPNLIPPIDTVAHACAYRERLQSLAPDLKFLMTLYLNKNITVETIAEAAAAGITGVKVYPTGVTTNSEGGVLDLMQYSPIFAAMQEHDLVLNLHGEKPSTPATAFGPNAGAGAITVLNAETAFLPTLMRLHKAFPRLRIVLEHCTTAEALAAVVACGPTVAATITAHHLWLTVDDWAGDAFAFCKPVAKTPADRVALVRAVVDQSRPGKFFFGSDSAPHPVEAKKGAAAGGKTAAGCFTQGWATQLVLGAMEEGVRRGWVSEEEASREAMEAFLSGSGRKFYALEPGPGRILVARMGETIPEKVESKDGTVTIVPFRAGKEQVYSIKWKRSC